MARARLIKPGFFTNEALVQLLFEIRLLFIGLWTLADRNGRLEDCPIRLKMELFPADNVDVEDALAQLEELRFIHRYETTAGVRCIHIANFRKHQSPHPREAISVLEPCPCEAGMGGQPTTATSRMAAEPVAAAAGMPEQPPASLLPDAHAKGSSPSVPIAVAGSSGSSVSSEAVADDPRSALQQPTGEPDDGFMSVPVAVREIRDMVLAALPPKYQRETFDEAEDFARDYEGQHDAVRQAIRQVRAQPGRMLPFPVHLRQFMAAPTAIGFAALPEGCKRVNGRVINRHGDDVTDAWVLEQRERAREL